MSAPRSAAERRSSARLGLVLCLVLALAAAVVALAPGASVSAPDRQRAGVLATALGATASFLWRVQRRLASAPRADERVVTPPVAGADARLAASLAALGIPLELQTTTPELALVGGFAKATIGRALLLIESGDDPRAEQALSTVIESAVIAPHAELHAVRAAAHFLRAGVRERRGAKAQACDDLAHALELAPDDAARQRYAHALRRLAAPPP